MFENPLVKTFVLSGLLVGLTVLTQGIIAPVEHAILGDAAGPRAWFYLPLGFWVFVAYFERWHAILYLAPGFAVGLMLYGAAGVPLMFHLKTLALLAVTAPVIFAILSWAAARPNAPMTEPVAWRLIFTAGLFTAVVNGISLHLVRYSVEPESVILPDVVQHIVGGVVGMMTCLFALSFAFRLRDGIRAR